MTPERLAALQARAYRHMAPWSERDFADLLALPTTLLVTSPGCFCLGRVVLDEAELLSLATEPMHQRRGLASRTFGNFLGAARQRGAGILFLEVAVSNVQALAFYRRHGFVRNGLRKGYYPRPDGPPTDALVMTRSLTQGQDAKS